MGRSVINIVHGILLLIWRLGGFWFLFSFQYDVIFLNGKWCWTRVWRSPPKGSSTLRGRVKVKACPTRRRKTTINLILSCANIRKWRRQLCQWVLPYQFKVTPVFAGCCVTSWAGGRRWHCYIDPSPPPPPLLSCHKTWTILIPLQNSWLWPHTGSGIFDHFIHIKC